MRLVWFLVVSCVVAFGAQTFFASLVNAEVSDSLKTVRAQHTYKNEVHELQGQVMVPSECHDLRTRVRDFDANSTVLVFESWERPYTLCEQKVPTARHFKVAIFAPEAIRFSAIVDYEMVPLVLVKAR